MSEIILPDQKPNTEEFKLVLGCKMNDKGEMQLHVNTGDEALLALMLRRLNQAVDVKMMQEARKQQVTGIQVAQATDLINRIKR